MSVPRKKLSGAEYRKRAKDKMKKAKDTAANMKKWLHGAGALPKAVDEIPDEAEFPKYMTASCNLQDQDCLSTISEQLVMDQSIEEPSSSTSNEQHNNIEPVCKELLSLGEQQVKENLDTIDLMDPSTWPVTEKMTDQQRSFLSNQAVLLAEKHPENVHFRSTEREGRHLTSSMWFRTLANEEKVKRSWLAYSESKNAILCTPCKIYPNTSTSALRTTGFINWKKALERLTEHEPSQIHKECMIKWKTRVQQMKSCQGIDRDIERLMHIEKQKWRQILQVLMDAVLYLATNCLSFRGSKENPSDIITDCPNPNQGNFLNLISLLAKHNSPLKYHLERIKKGQVSYLFYML